jgi:hypothetical protein
MEIIGTFRPMGPEFQIVFLANLPRVMGSPEPGPMLRLAHHLRLPSLLFAACALCGTSCSTTKEGALDNDGEVSMSRRMLNPDLTKRSSMEKLPSKTYGKYKKGDSYRTKSFQSEQFDEIQPFNATNFHAEQYHKKYAERLQEKTSWFSKLKWNQSDKQAAKQKARYQNMRFPTAEDYSTSPDRETKKSRDNGWHPFQKVINPNEPAQGEPGPINLKDSKLSVGDVKQMLNGG